MSTDISGVINRDENGRYSWEKSVIDVNDVDESFKTARDLGYTRLNYARVTTVSTLDKYDQKDMYAIQLQSNGKLRVTMKSGDSSDEKVLDLSEYESYLEDIKKELNPLDYAQDSIDKLQTDLNKDIFEENAPGLYMKVYMTQRGKQVLIADSTADKDSKLYQAAEEIMNGEYKAKKGNYFIETGFKADTEIPKDGTAYALQIQQGTSYKHDYITKEYKSDDSKNKKITKTVDQELANSTGSYGTTTISAAYAAQIQAQSYSTTATMLSNAYLNLASINTKTNKTAQIFSTLLDI